MGRPELGTKLTCLGCHEHFYDLNMSPAICPRCGAQQPRERSRMLRPSRSPPGTELQPQRPPAPVTIDIDEVEPAGTLEIEAEDQMPETDDRPGSGK
ncbi:MAG: TIGR02300 family protein [Acetobacteraceae bacterium]|nr:TIGR02300 family protein [Acetobacteraceae bacterium]